MFGFGGGIEWLIIGLVVLLLFGKRLPQAMRSVGQSIVEFKKGVNAVEEEPAQKSEESKV